MPYLTDNTQCADINPGNSTDLPNYCQYLIEGQEVRLCETNAGRPYYILLEAGRGEEIIVFHTERFVDAMTQQAGLPQRQKTDFALIGKYRDMNGHECAMIVLLELVDRLDDQIQHKIGQCDATYEFFCQNKLNFQDFHGHISAEVYRVFGEFRQHQVVAVIAPQQYNIARGKYSQGRWVGVYPVDGSLFVDRRSQKTREKRGGRNINYERPRAISFQGLLDALDGLRC